MTVALRSIMDALNGQLQSAAILPAPQIAWPNRTFVPTKGVPYLAVQMAGLSRQSLGAGADGVQQWNGFYQVSVFVPRDTGTRAQDDMANKVLDAFPRGLNLPTTNASPIVVTTSTVDAPVAYNDWLNAPCRIAWFLTEP